MVDRPWTISQNTESCRILWVAHAAESDSLDGVELFRRFNIHILPQWFVKIRRYGIYNHILKRNLELQFVKPDIDAIIKQQKKPETTIERLQRLKDINPCICPECKEGRKVTIIELPRIHSPAWLSFDIMLPIS